MLILSPYYLYLSDLSNNELLSLIDTVFYNWFQETKNQVRYWQKDQILSQGGIPCQSLGWFVSDVSRFYKADEG